MRKKQRFARWLNAMSARLATVIGMKRERCRRLAPLWMVGLTAILAPALIQANPERLVTPPPLDPDQPWEESMGRGENLMVKYMDLEPLGLRGQGRMVLHSLQPLVSMIRFDTVVGNPELWLKRMAGTSALSHWLLNRQKLGEVKLTGLEVLMTAEGIAFRFERAENGDGHLTRGRGRFSPDGLWAIRTGPLYLSRPPFKDLDPPIARPIGYGSMEVFGSRGRCKVILGEAFALDASTGNAVVNALWNDAATQGTIDQVRAEIGVEMSTFRVNDAFFEQGPRDLARGLLAYAGLTPSWGMAFPRITLSSTLTGPRFHAKTLRLSSPKLQVWGEAQGLWNPFPGTLAFKLEAKSPGRETKKFTWSSEEKRDDQPGS
ncbi:MAG: hypothetical protein HQL76_06520 [Magnetococcales bacterium]|nr:hypothetical protein [Magnetococcales bacterium]